jgi:cytoplasmic iron level regulating protein YaaA (DUF328/UPF0246 family)
MHFKEFRINIDFLHQFRCVPGQGAGHSVPCQNPPMLFLLSPAKSLDYETPLPPDVAATPPLFAKQSAELISVLREQSPQQIADLMHLSDALASLNVARYQAWRPRSTDKNARPAALAFNGDVYGGLDARSLAADDLAWAQDHVCILSGLYGVLRPLDRLQPYRLEMGSALANPQGKNLYQFWGTQISAYLNKRLRGDKTRTVVNLASQEYFKAVDRKALKGRVIDCVFEEFKNGQYKIISFMAKRARGLMARFAVQHQITTPRQLEKFNLEDYAFDAVASQSDRLVFRRLAKG